MISSDKIDINALMREIGVENLTPLPRDVSPREYFRGRKAGQDFVLMLYPEHSPENIKELKDFIRIGNWLQDRGIKSAQDIETNEEKCFALFEDLGEVSFGKALKQNQAPAEELYRLASDVLCVFRDANPLNLPDYYDGKVHANRRQLLDYYAAFRQGKKVSEEKIQEFFTVWDSIEKSLPPCPKGFVHGDYHLENLIYRPDDAGTKQCGLIDYQDALYGPLPYDLLNLLEDARATVPEDIKKATIDKYCAPMNSEQKQMFMQWYRVLCAQFHGRVLGLFIKLAAEQNRDSYLIHIPRLQNYIAESLKDPILAPLKSWFDKEGLDFTPIKDLHGDEIRRVFQNISF